MKKRWHNLHLYRSLWIVVLLFFLQFFRLASIGFYWTKLQKKKKKKKAYFKRWHWFNFCLSFTILFMCPYHLHLFSSFFFGTFDVTFSRFQIVIFVFLTNLVILADLLRNLLYEWFMIRKLADSILVCTCQEGVEPYHFYEFSFSLLSFNIFNVGFRSMLWITSHQTY